MGVRMISRIITIGFFDVDFEILRPKYAVDACLPDRGVMRVESERKGNRILKLLEYLRRIFIK